MSLGEWLKNMPDDVKVGTVLRIKMPENFPTNDQVQLHICDKPENVPYIPQVCDCTRDNCDCKPGPSALMRYDILHDKCVPITQEWINHEGARAAALQIENGSLRARITVLEIQNAELIRQTMRNMLAVDMPFVSATEVEPLPQSESDRIFWDALRMAAQT